MNPIIFRQGVCDPHIHVFQDDDGSAYLIVGECRLPAPCNCYFIARLNDDMVSLAEPLRPIEYRGNPCPEDKPSIHKYGGRYYLTHSSFYAISDSVYGPYHYVGILDATLIMEAFLPIIIRHILLPAAWIIPTGI